MTDQSQLPEFRYRLDRRYGDWDSWREYCNYEKLSDALFAKEEAFMKDHLDDSKYYYRIVEFRTVYEEE